VCGFKPRLVFGTAGSTTKRRVPHPPGFLLSLLGSANFMRLSLEKGAHTVLSSVAWQESGVLCALCKRWDTRRSVSRFVVSHPSQKARRTPAVSVSRQDRRPSRRNVERLSLLDDLASPGEHRCRSRLVARDHKPHWQVSLAVDDPLILGPRYTSWTVDSIP
jgi:hypothetical protein